MAYVRYTIIPVGESFSYRSNWNDPKEFVKTLKYVNKDQYRNCEYVENKWWKLVDFMKTHNGCRFSTIRFFLSRIRYWDATPVMRRLLIRTGTQNNYKYYLNQEGLSLWEKYFNTKPDANKLVKAKVRYIKMYDEAVAESKQYPILLHNYVANNAIEALP